MVGCDVASSDGALYARQEARYVEVGRVARGLWASSRESGDRIGLRLDERDLSSKYNVKPQGTSVSGVLGKK